MLIKNSGARKGWWPGPSAGLEPQASPQPLSPNPLPDLLEKGTTRAGWIGNWEFRLTLSLATLPK